MEIIFVTYAFPDGHEVTSRLWCGGEPSRAAPNVRKSSVGMTGRCRRPRRSRIVPEHGRGIASNSGVNDANSETVAEWDQEVDVRWSPATASADSAAVVIAAPEGAELAVVEKPATIGGTTAKSAAYLPGRAVTA